MKKIKFSFDTMFEPKETWFLLPMIMVDCEYDRFALCFGFLCFGVALEISKEDE